MVAVLQQVGVFGRRSQVFVNELGKQGRQVPKVEPLHHFLYETRDGRPQHKNADA